MIESTVGSPAEASAEVGVPSLPQRRPRVREVSSRFMSPLIQSNATPTPTPSEKSRSKSVHRRHSSRDENHVPETTRSLDTPLVLPQTVSHNRSLATNSVATVQKKQQLQRFRHFKENGEQNQQQQAASAVRVSLRPDTPIAIGTERIVLSRYRQTPHSVNRGNPMNSSSIGCTAVTAATRLLQEATSSSNNYRETVDKKHSRISTSRYDDSDSCSTASGQGSSSCPSSPLFMQTTKARSLPETRSSVSDVDKWLAERSSNNAGKVTSDCARSLNFSSSVKMGGSLCLPPHPSSCVRLGMDAKKGRKVSNHQEDVHSLKMLYNHYLQWRFANAKAEATVNTQKRETEIKLYSLGSKISDLRDEVKKKRSELGMLQGIKTLSMIVEAQMPYLDAWSALEEDSSTSLSGISNALLNSSQRVPVSGEVRVEVKDLQEALSSAVKVMKLIVSHVQRLMPKAEEVDTSISELARVVSGERALIEECGDLLSKKYTAQVKECSLRGALIQLHRRHIVDPEAVIIPVNPGVPIGVLNYYTKVGLGTPPSFCSTVIDTGNSSWIQCEPCHPQVGTHFDPSGSRMHKSLSRDTSQCSSLKDSTLNSPHCSFSNQYTGDKSCSYGTLSLPALSKPAPSNFVFGMWTGQRWTPFASNFDNTAIMGIINSKPLKFSMIFPIQELGLQPVAAASWHPWVPLPWHYH
ncbi:unnamed protein product [Fraxinus pennsylvanica]|uniref:Xylanase inhibitor N-terminal domain-containing protein n=1 Tax=Fraxinus pennsylvanica TaxID=56036 RepID=A0AAD1Z2S9_9LAMI|nr:unnamed protein product [Fraxinus pennsylvanica]